MVEAEAAARAEAKRGLEEAIAALTQESGKLKEVMAAAKTAVEEEVARRDQVAGESEALRDQHARVEEALNSGKATLEKQAKVTTGDMAAGFLLYLTSMG